MILLLFIISINAQLYQRFDPSCKDFEESDMLKWSAKTRLLYRPITIFNNGYYKCDKNILGNKALVYYKTYDRIEASSNTEEAKRQLFKSDYAKAESYIKKCNPKCNKYTTFELVLYGVILLIALIILLLGKYWLIILVVYLYHRIKN